jgi:hypothetical protein
MDSKTAGGFILVGALLICVSLSMLLGVWFGVILFGAFLMWVGINALIDNMNKCAIKIVDALIDDICNRSGLQNEWEQISEEDRKLIRSEWIDLVSEKMRGL